MESIKLEGVPDTVRPYGDEGKKMRLGNGRVVSHKEFRDEYFRGKYESGYKGKRVGVIRGGEYIRYE